MRTSLLSLLSGATALVFGAACSDGATIISQPEPADGPLPADEPLYALATGVCGPDSCQTYLGTTTSLEPRSLDLRGEGIELEGFVYPIDHGGALLVPEGESPALTRYTADESGALSRDVTLSFAGVGYPGTIPAGRARIIDDQKGYLFDDANGTIFIWNPTEMTVTDRQIDISMILRPGQDVFTAPWKAGARQRGDLLFVPLGWYDSTTFAARPVSGMLIIDTARDQVVKVLEDDRCPALEASIVTPSGDVYYGFPSAAGMLDVNARDPSFASCSLRIRDGETEFDPDYRLDVSALTGGRVACCGHSGGGSRAYVQVLHEERTTSITDRTMLFGSAHNDWRLWRIDLETEQAEEVTSVPWFGTSGVTPFELPEAVYRPLLTFDGDSGGLFSDVGRSTTLYDLTSGPEPQATIRTDASLLSFGRLR